MTAIARHPRILAATLLAGLAVLLSLLDPFAGGSPPQTAMAPARHASIRDDSDFEIYGHIVDDMRAGEGYYRAAVRELEARGRPVHPFPTVRLPTLVALRAALGGAAFDALHLVVTLAAAAALAWRLRGRNIPLVAAACVAGFWYDLQPALAMGHEMWAGPLVCLSLALRTERRWAASVAAAIAVCAIRETAITLPCVMLLTAVADRRRHESLAWGVALAAIAAGYAWHAHLATAAAAGIPQAGHAMGWVGVDGIAYAIGATAFATGLGAPGVPADVGVCAVMAGLLGWLRAAKDDPLARRVSIYLAGWILVMTVLAKIDNFYWAAMYAPLVPFGIAMLSRERTEGSGSQSTGG